MSPDSSKSSSTAIDSTPLQEEGVDKWSKHFKQNFERGHAMIEDLMNEATPRQKAVSEPDQSSAEIENSEWDDLGNPNVKPHRQFQSDVTKSRNDAKSQTRFHK